MLRPYQKLPENPTSSAQLFLIDGDESLISEEPLVARNNFWKELDSEETRHPYQQYADFRRKRPL